MPVLWLIAMTNDNLNIIPIIQYHNASPAHPYESRLHYNTIQMAIVTGTPL